MSGATVQKNFRLPVELAERLAVEAGVAGCGQTAIVVRALERELFDQAVSASGERLKVTAGLLERTEPAA